MRRDWERIARGYGLPPDTERAKLAAHATLERAVRRSVCEQLDKAVAERDQARFELERARGEVARLTTWSTPTPSGEWTEEAWDLLAERVKTAEERLALLDGRVSQHRSDTMTTIAKVRAEVMELGAPAPYPVTQKDVGRLTGVIDALQARLEALEQWADPQPRGVTGEVTERDADWQPPDYGGPDAPTEGETSG